MSEERDRSRSGAGHFTSNATIDDDEVLVLDFTGSPWALVDHRPQHKGRPQGFDPYNTADPPPKKQAWLRIDRR